MKYLKDFMAGIGDLMVTMDITPEAVLFEDLPERISFNFKTTVHEFTIGYEVADPEEYAKFGLGDPDFIHGLSCVTWHGSGEHSIAEGDFCKKTWKAIKSAVQKEDQDCGYGCPAPLRAVKSGEKGEG